MTLDDLDKVYKELYEVKVQWKTIGLELGLTITKLNCIESDRHYKAEPSCLDMLSEWLSNGTHRSWSALADALESPIVNHSNTAAAIREKYCN